MAGVRGRDVELAVLGQRHIAADIPSDDEDGIALLRERAETEPVPTPPPVTRPAGSCSARMPRPKAWAILLIIGALLLAIVIGVMAIPHGFVNPLDVKARFFQTTNATSAGEILRYLTSAPHLAGTAEDLAQAHFVRDKFLSYGFNDTALFTYKVLLSTPLARSVQMLAPTMFNLSLQEPVLPEDPTSGDPRIVPTFNGYAPSGFAQGQLVYVNFGRFEDFAMLTSLGVNVSGCICIARYGRVFRGVKAMLAERNGCAGLLIYSDPQQDGFTQGPVYPNGPWRPAGGVQRGSVQYLSLGPGDPQTPGYPSTDYATRLPLSDIQGKSIPSIPVQPIGYGDAQPLLQELGGAFVTSNDNTSNWQGGLPFVYRLGPGPAVVAINLTMNFTTSPIWNVVGKIAGREDPDQWIVVGAHRDAWTFGATDPSSATALLVELARGLSDLFNQGWRPRRSIVLASWDAEEYSLIGSTEWCEDFARELSMNAVAYINVDTAVASNNFSAAATPPLVDLIINATMRVAEPRTGRTVSVYDRWITRQRLSEPSLSRPIVDNLGSGSDYTPFFQHLGIPALDFDFDSGAAADAQYHSAYDSWHWMQTFGDPGFEYFQALAKIWGYVTIRLADDKIIPMNYSAYSDVLTSSLNSLQLSMTNSTGWNSSQILQPLRDVVNGVWNAAAVNIDRDINTIIAWENYGQPLEHKYYREVNDRLQRTERAFLLPEGLPGRSWFKHAIFAPGLYLGYGAVVFPAVVEAVQNNDYNATVAAVSRIIDCVKCAANTLDGEECSPHLNIGFHNKFAHTSPSAAQAAPPSSTASQSSARKHSKIPRFVPMYDSWA
eukprot:TRINITY_DN6973_c0_g1_i1.p1 TRINITY_DN6973_c0_g1~~TRINITY_DN6973_c0_g1_i1.p1  ORF type:complete len:830 (-),score=136.68 TRINITY_DN6973_c0_g1_i1:1179-3668(-)